MFGGKILNLKKFKTSILEIFQGQFDIEAQGQVH